MSSKMRFGGRILPQKRPAKAPKAEAPASARSSEPASDYGKGGVYRAVGGGRRVRVTG
jgi:hypothetical protein